MIEITGTYKEIKIILPETTIGTCNYVAQIFDVTGEVLHTATAVNGIVVQWITSNISLLNAKDLAVEEIAKQKPLAPENPPLTMTPDEAALNW